MVGLHTPRILPLCAEPRVVAPVLARVMLTQYFANTNHTNVPAQVSYVFPVPAGGAVCGFEMHTADGKTIIGKVKEARQAEAEFKEAVADNRTAGLLAKETPDGKTSIAAKRIPLTSSNSLYDGIGRHTSETSD